MNEFEDEEEPGYLTSDALESHGPPSDHALSDADDPHTDPLPIPDVSLDPDPVAAEDGGTPIPLFAIDRQSSELTYSHSGRGRRRLILAGCVAAVVAILMITWLALPSPTPAPTDTRSPTTSAVASTSAEQERLTTLIGRQFPARACRPERLIAQAIAALVCTSSEPGSPQTATYTVLADSRAVHAALDTVVHSMAVELCPGNIQSPGPWHRAASPETAVGTVVCGRRGGVPTVAWTTEASRTLSVIQSAQRDVPLDGLYTWWSHHS